MEQINWNNVEESNGEYPKLVAGGYIVKITSAVDVPINSQGKGDYTKLTYDIADGEFKGFFSDKFYNDKEYMHSFIRSYKENARGMYKAFFKRMEESTPNFSFDGNVKNPSQFVNKYVGIVLSEEEYYNTNNELKTRLYVSDVKSTKDIREGNFKIKELKRTSSSPTPANANGSIGDFQPTGIDEELPFM